MQNICYHVAAVTVPFKFDMQHDHVLKKLTFDLGGGGFCRKNICYHVAAFRDSI